MTNLNPNEVKVLAALNTGSDDFGFYPFDTVCRYTKLKRNVVRRACRSLKRKGLARYGMGLWTDDGEPAGSGYAITKDGRGLADAKLTERYEARGWRVGA